MANPSRVPVDTSKLALTALSVVRPKADFSSPTRAQQLTADGVPKWTVEVGYPTSEDMISFRVTFAMPVPPTISVGMTLTVTGLEVGAFVDGTRARLFFNAASVSPAAAVKATP